MRIIIDIRPLEGAKYGGVAEYINNLLPELFKTYPQHTFLLFSNSFRSPKRNYAHFLDYANVRMYKFRFPNRLLFFTSRFFKWPKIDKLVGGADVLLSPHFFPAPVTKSCKTVTVFHDISFVNFPEFFDRNRRIWHKFVVNPKKQAILSDEIVAVSNSTKEDLINIYKIPKSKIRVVYSGINKKLLNQDSISLDKLKLKYKLPENYILTLSSIGHRKNIASLIYAFDYLAQKAEFKDLFLVVVGGYERGYKNKIKKIISESKHGDRIIFTGPIEEQYKSAFYKNAQVFVWPSLYEGFGFPPLEAMYCSVPVLVSSTTSLPEITGGAALLINPLAPKEIASAISEILNDKHLRNHFIANGRRRAEEFDWGKTAKEVMAVLSS